MDRFDIILADPPWEYDGGGDRGARHHYPTMSTEAICSLDIRARSEDNAALFLWCVWPRIFDAQNVIQAWGFRYATVAWVWVKMRPKGMGLHAGMGYYTRSNTEPCLLGVRGKMPVAVHNVLGVIWSPVRQHSRKPDEQYGKIERLYPGRRRLELFARRARAGWSAWGNEIRSDISIGGDA